jgi:outer membrane protein TolC
MRAGSLLVAIVAAPASVGSEPARLTLDEAATLALRSQPLIEARRARVRAAQASAVAAAQLPDPVLVGTVDDLTVTGPHPFTLRNEDATQFRVGIRQDVPGGDKRALRGARAWLDVERGDIEVLEQQRSIGRASSLAWLEVWKTVRQAAALGAGIETARMQAEAAAIGYRSGRGTQADVLSAEFAAALLDDERTAIDQNTVHARNGLRRWIGADADRPVALELPPWPAPDAAAILAALEHHPHVRAQAKLIEAARADLKLAEADYRPDWSVQVSYGYRPEFSDFAAVEFEIGLPLFTARRQDQQVVARLAELDAAEQMQLDWLRQHAAEIQLNAADWHTLRARLDRYERDIAPQAAARLEAAVAAYGAGTAPIAGALDARRALVDLELQRVELEYDAARHQIELQYFLHAEGMP